MPQSRVRYLADDRKQESLDGFWPTLTPAQRDGITAVAMDMWEPYVQSTRTHLPGADQKSVFDKFHVVKHLHDAVDRVRRGEPRPLKRVGDERLTGSKSLWLRRPEELSETRRAAFRALQRDDLKVGRAWGPSRSASAPSGSTAAPARPPPSSPVGSGGRRIAGSSPWRPSPS